MDENGRVIAKVGGGARTAEATGAYDRTLADSITRCAIERVEITGSGTDDEFAGGSGNDVFDGGEGHDTVVFEGDRDDYRIRQLDSGGVQVADLRKHSPDGTDLFWNVEAFVFRGEDYDLV